MTTDKTNDIATCTAKSTPTSRAVLTMLANLLQGNYPLSHPKDLLADALNKSPEIPSIQNEASAGGIRLDIEEGVLGFTVGRYNSRDRYDLGMEHTLRLHLAEISTNEYSEFGEVPEEKPAEESGESSATDTPSNEDFVTKAAVEDTYRNPDHS